MSMADCPTLPPELWNRILESFNREQDLSELWMSQRHVCTMFRDLVEAIFREKHLKKTWVQFSASSGSVQFEFSRLSEDKNFVHFVTGDLEGVSKEGKEAIRQNLTDATIKLYPRNQEGILTPPYIVQIHRDVNDTPIPGLVIDCENFKISFDWRAMYTRFYAEDSLYHKLLSAWTKDKKKVMEVLGKQMERGEINMGVVLEKAITMFAGGSDDAWKTARRARVRGVLKERGLELSSYEEVDDPDSDEMYVEEKRVLRQLAELRQLVSLEDDSDFDFDGGEEEEESEEESEEDEEWESASDDEDEDDIMVEDPALD